MSLVVWRSVWKCSDTVVFLDILVGLSTGLRRSIHSQLPSKVDRCAAHALYGSKWLWLPKGKTTLPTACHSLAMLPLIRLLLHCSEISPSQDLVTCLYIFCFQWGWDARVPALKNLESHRESILRWLKLFSSLYLIYLGEQCFCLCSKVFLDGFASQHGTEKWHVTKSCKGPIDTKFIANETNFTHISGILDTHWP